MIKFFTGLAFGLAIGAIIVSVAGIGTSDITNGPNVSPIVAAEEAISRSESCIQYKWVSDDSAKRERVLWDALKTLESDINKMPCIHKDDVQRINDVRSKWSAMFSLSRSFKDAMSVVGCK